MGDDALTPALAALGHPIRMSLYRRLKVAGPAGCGPVALAAALGLQQNLVSYHLRPLVTVGLVRSERRGRDVNYRIVPAGLDRLVTMLLALGMDEGGRFPGHDTAVEVALDIDGPDRDAMDRLG